MRKLFPTLLLLALAVVAAGQNPFVVQNGATLSLTGGATITLQDFDLQNDGIIDPSGHGTIRFTGVNGSLLSGIGALLFDTLEVAKTGGAGIKLSRSATIGSTLRFTTGTVELGGGNIFLQPGAVFTGESETSRVMSTMGGYVQITSMLNAPAAVNPGNLGVVLTSPQNLGTTVIRRGHAAQTTGAGAGITRYYSITPANDNNLGATLRLTYLKAELNNVAENALTIWKSTDSTTWTSVGATTLNPASNYVEVTGINDLSYWTLAGTNPLPLQFLSFTAQCASPGAILRWQTAQEQNVHNFEVQFSPDGSAWTNHGALPAAGNSVSQQDYSFIDTAADPSGFYRIEEVDDNGNAQYTSVKHLNCSLIGGSLEAAPNPAHRLLTVNLNLTAANRVTVSVFDNRGALLLRQFNSLNSGPNQFTVDMGGLVPGMYFLHLQWGNNHRSLPVLKVD